MSSPAAATVRAAPPRIVFLTRDPVVHERSGSSTYICGLLALLRAQGAVVTVVSTTAWSRSPRLFFRVLTALPGGVAFHAPGYLRLGRWYVLPWRATAWARVLTRTAARWPALGLMARLCGRIFAGRLYTGAWDLTAPTNAEGAAAIKAVSVARATAVVANYCLWGPLLGSGRLGIPRTAILMHDLLSARVERFRQTGIPLDMPPLTESEELRWLSGAATVLAAQAGEAAQIRPKLHANVLVSPVVLQPTVLPAHALLPGRCLFVGSNIAPNQAALSFLLTAVWPQVRKALPHATLAVAGTVGRKLDASASAAMGVLALGVVPSLEAEYSRAAVCLVPLLFGTGIKIKLLEALGFGKAVVSTRAGVDGIEDWACGAVTVADRAEDFAAAIIRLLSDDAWRCDRQRAALAAAEQHLGPRQVLSSAFTAALL